ncbi:hypothetical protein QBC33DRAFT_170665 [Phialemonium atrogriseum]|uniref:Cyclin N-terminal domain-containing protein n=1 Tax=Phialemonium atrogriseum TaxID=1093897 RepID=A0AAJ0CAE8_9PEZI|nr:uncharacterized protein QBC33DRAFT_170665 [Phialemonium atrogriseum]KAK1771888.1 hypothetical protein QBC33DRAFT_170665 [Phialemonium atrogriseum]
MESISYLSMGELNAAALDNFVYQPVSRSMITYLAEAAHQVIQCDPTMMPPPTSDAARTPSRTELPPTPPRSPPPRAVRSDDGSLPSLEEFITQLVVSSNVQVPTLMSTLVYLNRLKSRLQPMAKGLRCTTHRILLASLILAAKYLNDSSPKNKHWANYSVISNEVYNFGFSRTEVNLMEKQLLFLLDWDLRITEEDLYRELDHFLAPIRQDTQERHVRKQRRKAEERAALRKREEAEAWIAIANSGSTAGLAYATPPSSRGSSRSRYAARPPAESARDASPPGLSYSSSRSSASSYASSSSSSLANSRATTPLSDPEDPQPYVYGTDAVYDSPVEVVLERPQVPGKDTYTRKGGKSLLPYEISAEELREIQEGGNKVKRMRGVFGRVFGGGQGVTVR